MKKGLLIFLMSAVVGVSTAKDAPAKVPTPWEVTIFPDESTHKPGDPIWLKIVVRNNGNRTSTLSRVPGGHAADIFYRISVLDSNRKPAKSALSPWQQTHRGGDSSFIVLTVNPGEEIVDRELVSNLFDMKGADTYLVQVAREFPREQGGLIRSNELAIKVAK